MFIQSLSGVLAASLLALAIGCDSDGGHSKGTHTMPDGSTMSGTSHAVMCPKCETVWTQEMSGTGKAQHMTSKSGMVCPTCEKMAASYMKDGDKMLHNCPECKVTPVELKSAPAAAAKGPHGAT